MSSIQAKGYEVDLTRNEAWTLTMILKHEMEGVISDPHYERYPDSLSQNASEKIRLFRSFAYAVGRPDIYEDTMKKVHDYLSEVKAQGESHE